MVNFSHTSGYLGVMQLVYSILLPSGYVGAAYVLKGPMTCYFMDALI